jgi:hypothetical protein
MLHVVQTLSIPLLQLFCKSGHLDVKNFCPVLRPNRLTPRLDYYSKLSLLQSPCLKPEAYVLPVERVETH